MRLTAALVRRIYLPTMLVGFNGLAIWLASNDAPKVLIVAVLLSAVALSFAAERAAPYRNEWNTNHADRSRDLAHGLVNECLQIASLLALPSVASVVPDSDLWPGDLPFALQVLMSLLVLDAGITLGHYWSHQWKPLWRLHSVHHSVRRFYGLNGLMKHPLHQLFETALATTPLILIGMPADVATALVACVGIQLLVQHSNVDYDTGPLVYVLAVNRVHRFHHLRWPGVGDVNFGLFTTIWDRLLGTAVYLPDATFDSNDLGIAAEPNYPNGYLEQLTEPFRPYEPMPVAPPARWAALMEHS